MCVSYAYHMQLNSHFFQGYSIGFCSLNDISQEMRMKPTTMEIKRAEERHAVVNVSLLFDDQPDPGVCRLSHWVVSGSDVRSRKAFWPGTCGMTISAALRLPLGSWGFLILSDSCSKAWKQQAPNDRLQLWIFSGGNLETSMIFRCVKSGELRVTVPTILALPSCRRQ